MIPNCLSGYEVMYQICDAKSFSDIKYLFCDWEFYEDLLPMYKAQRDFIKRGLIELDKQPASFFDGYENDYIKMKVFASLVDICPCPIDLNSELGHSILRELHIDLDRYIKAQDRRVDGYEQALQEIKNGKKVEHWMWYIFPQPDCYGHSWESKYYGVHGRPEAIAFMNHSLLRQRLETVFQAVMDSPNSPQYIFGDDWIKCRSCCILMNSVKKSKTIAVAADKFMWR